MPSTGELGRTPPQDLAAEQSVLGGMLLSKDAIADVVEVVRGHDFYRPAHELVYEAVLDLYGRGEPADAVTVSAELQKRGELGRVGGAPYLHTLLQSVPTAANAGYYARIVRETAILRRLIEAGTKIVQLGYTGDGDADDIVDAAQVEVYNVTDRRTSGTTSRSRRSWRAPSTRSRRSAPAAARWSASRRASPTSTSSPTACTPAR